MIILEEKWTGLRYRGNWFGDIFEISTLGKVRNIGSGNLTLTKRENRLISCVIYYKGKNYRINIGEAQEDSGLERTIMDLPRKVNKPTVGERVEALEDRVRYLEELLEVHKLMI